MLTFYYHPLSPIARRVWVALLEKAIPFEPIVVNLNGEQLKPEFLSLNPFHHVPVIVDGELRVLESLAILDYLEAKYPEPSLSPKSPEAIAQMKMIQLVTTNELTPKLPALVNLSDAEASDNSTVQQIKTVLSFFAEQLAGTEYFTGETFSLADITAGTAISLVVRLGITLEEYPAITAWYDRLRERDSWQKTELSDESFETWRRWVALMIKRRQRQPIKTAVKA